MSGLVGDPANDIHLWHYKLVEHVVWRRGVEPYISSNVDQACKLSPLVYLERLGGDLKHGVSFGFQLDAWFFSKIIPESRIEIIILF